MKKLLAILLLLCFACSSALAISSEDLHIEKSHMHEYTEGDVMYLHVVFELVNRSDKNISPNTAIVLMNNEGAIFTEKSTMLHPMILAPGERGYVQGVFELNSDMQALYDHPELYLSFPQLSEEEQQMMDDVQKALVFPTTESTIDGSSVMTTVSNDTVIDIMLAPALMLYRNDAGDIVGVAETYILSLPMGEKTEVAHEFTLAPFTSVEVVCYTMPM